jgi:hypothetical protein
VWHTVRFLVCDQKLHTRPQKVRNEGTMNNISKTANSNITNDGCVSSGSISVTLYRRRRDQH